MLYIRDDDKCANDPAWLSYCFMRMATDKRIVMNECMYVIIYEKKNKKEHGILPSNLYKRKKM
jgi:hypothetical protein